MALGFCSRPRRQQDRTPICLAKEMLGQISICLRMQGSFGCGASDVTMKKNSHNERALRAQTEFVKRQRQRLLLSNRNSLLVMTSTTPTTIFK
jgi:hypothetical protein